MNDSLKLIVIAGPTAVGKTDLSIKLALNLGCEIISADSRQIYKEMNIGTAKPSVKELEVVKHHFINYKSIHDYYSAGRFEVDVLSMLNQYRKKNIIMVGGSGLYIKAVCDGIDRMPDPDLKLRKIIQDRFEKYGLENLAEELKTLDLDSWKSIDIQNPNRVIRALEVIHQTGKKYSDFKNDDLQEDKNIFFFRNESTMAFRVNAEILNISPSVLWNYWKDIKTPRILKIKKMDKAELGLLKEFEPQLKTRSNLSKAWILILVAGVLYGLFGLYIQITRGHIVTGMRD